MVSRPDGGPVPGVITVRSNGSLAAGSFSTNPSGLLTLPAFTCTPDVAVRVRPQNSNHTSDGQWRACSQNPIEYPMIPRRSAALVRGQGALPSWLLADQQALLAAMDTDDSRVGDLSREMAAKLRAGGWSQAAMNYSALAIESDAETLRAHGVDMPEVVVKWDPGQKALVSTPETIEALKAFQTERAITPSGRWDQRTAQAITGLSTRF